MLFTNANAILRLKNSVTQEQQETALDAQQKLLVNVTPVVTMSRHRQIPFF